MSCRHIYSHKFDNIFYCFQVFLVCLLCLQSAGAVIGEDCTVNGNCTNSNGACVELKCGCLSTHFIDGSECTQSKFITIRWLFMLDFKFTFFQFLKNLQVIFRILLTGSPGSVSGYLTF